MSNRRKIKSLRAQYMEDNAYWNGLPTTAVRGTAVVADAPEFPAYWARTEGIVGQRIPVVWVSLDGVNSGGGVQHLDDRDGSGWRKVTAGHGGPGWPHRNVAIEEGSFIAPSAPSGDAQGGRAHRGGTAAQGSVQGDSGGKR